MIWLWILGILAVLIVLLCWTRVGIHAEMDRESVTVDIKLGLLHLRVLPAKEKPKKTKKSAKKAESGKEAGKEKPKKTLPNITLEDIQDAVRTLAPPLKKALQRTRRGIRVEPLALSVTVGGSKDPASAAELYGYLHAGIWTAMPILEQLLVIPAPYIHVGIDFDASEAVLEGRLGISIRIGTLLTIGMGMGIPALRWFLQFQKKNRPQPASAKREPAKHAAA